MLYRIFPVIVMLLCVNVIYSQVIDSLAADTLATGSLTIDYNYINSSPQNAEVYANDEYLGSTPIFFKWRDSTYPKQLAVKLKGYADYTETIFDGSPIKKNYVLVPLTGSSKIRLVERDKNTHFEKPRKIIPIVLSGLVTAGAGAAAYYFKSLAIENRDHYDSYGDQESLDKKEKYDLISGVSLAAFQLGLGALIYFLLIDN